MQVVLPTSQTPPKRGGRPLDSLSEPPQCFMGWVHWLKPVGRQGFGVVCWGCQKKLIPTLTGVSHEDWGEMFGNLSLPLPLGARDPKVGKTKYRLD